MQSSSTHFLQNKFTTTTAFAVALLLFFLPFSEIRCNNTTIAVFSGKNMVMGEAPQVSEEMKSLQNGFGEGENKAKDDVEGKVFIAAIIAFALTVIGLVLSLMRNPSQGKMIAGVGLAGVLALIALIYEAKNWINKETVRPESGDLQTPMMKADMNFTIWFYLCMFAFLAAAFFGYHHHKESISSVPVPREESDTENTRGPEVPPNAPQVPIQNPGDQSEFPAAPSGDKGLG